MRIALIIAAAGAGTRFAGGDACCNSFASCDKLWMELDGEPLWVRSLRNLGGKVTGDIILAVRPDRYDEFCEVLDKARLPWPIKVITGGASRIESVCKALDALESNDGLVAIHDAARPLADQELFGELLRFAVENYPAGILPAVRAADTVKTVDIHGNVTGDIDRDTIALVGTPQIFPLREYKAAAASVLAGGKGRFTDDAGIFLDAGGEVKVFFSARYNTKVTVQDDYTCVKAFAAAANCGGN